MSSFTIIGFFALANGCHLQTIKPGTETRTWHAHYTTTVQCSNPPFIPADLRIYSPLTTSSILTILLHLPLLVFISLTVGIYLWMQSILFLALVTHHRIHTTKLC